MYSSFPFCEFHILVVPSSEDEIKYGQCGWKSIDFTGPECPSYIWITCCDLKSYNFIFLSCEQDAKQFPNEWNFAWWMTPLCYWYVWIGFLVFKSQIIIFLSSHDTILVAVGEN